MSVSFQYKAGMSSIYEQTQQITAY